MTQVLLKYLKNKFVLTILLFLIWMVLFDQNNWIDRWKNIRALHKMEADREYYQEKIIEDAEKLKELKSSKENLEKFAREQYLMKKKNEEIILIVED